MDRIKLIASDMDHTLLTEKGELPPDFDRYVLALEKSQIIFTIASGRPLYTLTDVFPTLKDHLSFISDNGGIISHGGKIIFKSLLDVSDYQAMIQFTEKACGQVPVICGLDCAFVPKQYRIHDETLRIFYTRIDYVDDLTKIAAEADKFTIYYPDNNSKDYFDTLFFPEFGNRFSVTLGGPCWIDIMNPGVHKGGAIKILGDHLGLSSEEMMAFGDTYNDIEMLQAVKHSYVVENASTDMRRYANYIAPSNDEYGVLQILKRVLSAHGNTSI